VTIVPQDCGCGGNKGEAEAAPAAQGFIYAIGSLRTVEPTPGLSKEFGFAVSSLRNWLPDGELPYEVLSQGQYLYIARELCWVLQIDGSNAGASVDAYIVKPRSHVELYEMVSGLEPISTSDRRFDVIIGPRGPIVDSDAVIEALARGRLGYAAFDVYEIDGKGLGSLDRNPTQRGREQQAEAQRASPGRGHIAAFDTRKLQAANAPVMNAAMREIQGGMSVPAICTGQPRAARVSCTTAITVKKNPVTRT